MTHFKRTAAIALAVFGLTSIATSSAIGQIDATITKIVDQFNEIENALPSMQHITVDASHTDSDYFLGKMDIWMDPQGKFAKLRNERRTGDSVDVQELWGYGNDLIFVFNRSEWTQAADQTVSINETRYYIDNKKVIREMYRSGQRSVGSNLDISNEPHTTNDQFDPESSKAIYEEEDKRAQEIAQSARVISQWPGGTPNFLSLPYRLLLNTVSPDGKYAFAWGINGIKNPDWLAWEEKSYDYIDSLGAEVFDLHLISVTDGSILHTISDLYQPLGNFYMWTDWVSDGSHVAMGFDARFFTPEAKILKISNNSVSDLTELTAALSPIALDVLRQNDHPYAINSDSAEGFIDIKQFLPDGTLDIRYEISSKLEGPRYNASLDLNLRIDFTTGQLTLISSALPNYTPIPTTWDKAESHIISKVSQWLTQPPALEDYQQLYTSYTDGVVYLYNQFGQFFNPDNLEIFTRRPLFLSGPHSPGYLNNESRFEFGHYDPDTITDIAKNVSYMLNDTFVSITRPLYEGRFKSTAHHFQETLHYWQSNPSELERQKAIYLAHLENQTLPEMYYLLDGDLAETLMDQYSTDWGAKMSYLTGIRFWMRRSCDGSYHAFADLLQKVIRAYEPDYYSTRGLPELTIDSYDENEATGTVELLMEENGVLGIDHLTTLDLTTLQQKLPNLTVKAATLYDEGGEYPGFKAFLGSAEVLTVTNYGTGDANMFEARSVNMQLRNGIATGSTFAEVFKNQKPLGYYFGVETDVGGIIAEAPGSERITLIFSPPEDYQLTNTVPPLEDIGHFTLTEMKWRP